MGSGYVSKLIRNTLVVSLIAIFIGYAALAYINKAENSLPAKPATQTYVQDKAALLSSQEQEKLEKSCENLYADTGIKLVFLTVDNLPGSYTLDEYASGVYKKWELNKTPNPSLLFVYDKKDGKAIFETLAGNDNYTSNFNAKFIVFYAEDAIISGKSYQAFDSIVTDIANDKNGIAPIIPDHTDIASPAVTSDIDSSFIPESINRATIIKFVFELIIFLFVMKKIFSKVKNPVKIKVSKGNNYKHKNNIPVAYRRSYDEEYGDKDHIYS
ncbi:MAG: TPM domain-containing protein [Solirubrobacterales bacterium]